MGYLVVLGVVVMSVVWFVAIYNGFVRKKNMVFEGWSGIDVQLQRRADLIPNLLETVKGYMRHERELLSKVTELRSRSAQTQDITERGRLEGQLGMALANLFAVAEAYPDLKANQNFQDLQKELAEIEDEIQLARRYYNGTVRNYNIQVESFPSNIVAGIFRFKLQAYFEIEDKADRAVPEVKF